TKKVNVLGEFGGIGLVVEGHLWQTDRNWGYVRFKDSKEVTDKYIEFAGQLKETISRGYSAAVYTQTTDVECEVNGLMTYDRKVIKIEEDRVRQVNREICNSLSMSAD
ncbi:MAG: beta-galactosidase, partial [Prevotellaceae bacterium]|nr:beta-galactosidase [Prevotellaceae bacterium]